jgi:stage IV sporulation protein B
MSKIKSNLKFKSKSGHSTEKRKVVKKMNCRKFLNRLSQSAAAFTAAVCAAIMTSVGYYSAALPDSYSCGFGEEISLNTVLPITAADLSESAACTNVDFSDGVAHQTKSVSLNLFGSVPIKEVKEETVDRPLLAVGGQAFGIKLVTDGVMIIDMKNVGGSCPAKEAGLKIGDVIEAVNGERVSTNSRISEIIKESGGEDCEILYRRSDKERQCTLTPVLSEGSYRAGMWVRDSSAGIGTMTFFDPQTLSFAGLGHAICDSDTQEELPLSNGSISDVKIKSCTKSEKGAPGQLNGEFYGEETGELLLNCEGGVYGRLNELPEEYTTYPLGFAQEVEEGKAYIIAQTGSGAPKEYEISIEKISLDGEHNLTVKVTDEELIAETGGIVQGMSGSPIIQNGRIVGAVTHVFIDDPTGGYGIFAERMYNYAEEAISENSADSLAG